MKTYNELNLDEKKELEQTISEVMKILPENNTFFASEIIDSQDNKVLKTKQDYDKDKNEILQIIEEKRKNGFFDKETSKKMKKAIIIIFNEFIRISPRKIYKVDDEKDIEESVEIKEETKDRMSVADIYAEIHGTYVKLPEKLVYKLIDIPGNEEKQTMQYYIATPNDIQYVGKEEVIKR